MPRPQSPRQPSYRQHKGSGQAVVTIYGRDFYLGRYGTPESKKAYKRLMLEWLANDGVPPPPPPQDLTVSELAAAYKAYAKRYYVRDGKPTEMYQNVRYVMRFLGRSPYGTTRAIEFGPLALKSLRGLMIDADNSRCYVNAQVAIIKRAFKWACSEEMLPVTVLQGLLTVDGLRYGKSRAKENAPVMPVPVATVEATLPYLPPVVDDMIRLLQLLGCRPGELCSMRPRNVDRSGTVWVYRPDHHKTAFKGRERLIFIGPKAQGVLAPYLLRGADSYCFSAAESDARRRAVISEARKTPQSCGNTVGSNRKRKPRRKPGEVYLPSALNVAVARGCEKAFKMPQELRKISKKLPAAERRRLLDRASAWRREHCWFPYQLRHSFATELRKQYGLEAAQVILGHSKADVTQIYAERDSAKAEAIMAAIG